MTHYKLTPEILSTSLSQGRKFLLNAQKEAGNFMYEYDFIARTFSENDNEVRQAGTLWGLALIHRYQPSEETKRAIIKCLAFFDQYSKTENNIKRILYPQTRTSKTGTIALIILALVEFLHTEKDAELGAKYEKDLADYLRFLISLRTGNGQFYASYHADGMGFGQPSSYFDGEALLALIKSAKYSSLLNLDQRLIIKSADEMYKINFKDAIKIEPDSDITKGFYQWGSMKTNLLSQLINTLKMANSHGKPFIYEEAGNRTLYLGIGPTQSKMKASDPYRLMLGYTRTMMGFLLFNSYPAQITMIGLGGGSLPKYCYRYLLESQITVVEIRPEVIALRDQFYIPRDNERFRVICKDGAEYVQQSDIPIDILIVDGFDEREQAPQLGNQSFYDHCYAALDTDGVMVVNMFCPDPLFDVYLSRIRRSFKHSVIKVAAEDSNNKIVFAGKGSSFKMSGKQVKEKVQQLEIQYPIDFWRVGSALREQRKVRV